MGFCLYSMARILPMSVMAYADIHPTNLEWVRFCMMYYNIRRNLISPIQEYLQSPKRGTRVCSVGKFSLNCFSLK